MSAEVTLMNKTNTNVTFGLYSAPNDHDWSQSVHAGQESEPHSIHADARTIGVWQSNTLLYPNDDSPFVKGYSFQDGQSYVVTLSPTEITVSSS